MVDFFSRGGGRGVSERGERRRTGRQQPTARLPLFFVLLHSISKPTKPTRVRTGVSHEINTHSLRHREFLQLQGLMSPAPGSGGPPPPPPTPTAPPAAAPGLRDIFLRAGRAALFLLPTSSSSSKLWHARAPRAGSGGVARGRRASARERGGGVCPRTPSSLLSSPLLSALRRPPSQRRNCKV